MPTEEQRKWIESLGGGRTSAALAADSSSSGSVPGKEDEAHASDASGGGVFDRLGGVVKDSKDAIDKTAKDLGQIAGKLAISAPVGRHGKNKLEDVKAVQFALNSRGGAKLDVDGKCGSKTIDAIKAYQKKLGMPYPDGLIEPGNRTERALNGDAAAVAEHKSAAGDSGQNAAAPSIGAGTGSKPDALTGKAAKASASPSGKAKPGKSKRQKKLAPAPDAKAPADPDNAKDQGGVAKVTDLEQDMRELLDEWNAGALEGVHQFVTNELSKRLDALESGNWGNFIVGLVGNTMWAAAAFMPVGAGIAAFALSMEGIAVAAAPTVPSESQSPIPTIQQAMVDQINSVHDQLDKSLRNKAAALVKSNPCIARYRAMAMFLEASFKKGLIAIDASYKTKPRMNKTHIREVYASKAEIALEKALAAIEAENKRKLKEAAAKLGFSVE